jgi:hypothetical protein
VNPQPFEARLAHLEGAFAQVADRLGIFAARFGLIDQRFTTLEQRITWLIGIVVGIWITTILAILFHH